MSADDTAPSRRSQHVIPAQDAVSHEASADCPCGPTTEHIQSPNGGGWLNIHHSLDDREKTAMNEERGPIIDCTNDPEATARNRAEDAREAAMSSKPRPTLRLAWLHIKMRMRR